MAEAYLQDGFSSVYICYEIMFAEVSFRTLGSISKSIIEIEGLVMSGNVIQKTTIRLPSKNSVVKRHFNRFVKSLKGLCETGVTLKYCGVSYPKVLLGNGLRDDVLLDRIGNNDKLWSI